MAGGKPQTVQYTMQLHSRALAAVAGESSRSQWLVGSTSLREENEVRLLEYDPDQEALLSLGVWAHPEEVWEVAPCPIASDRLATVHSRGGQYGATLWQAQRGQHQLAPLARLPHEGVVRSVLWSQAAPDLLITIEEGALRKWQLGAGDAQCVASCGPGEGPPLWGGAAHRRDAGVAAAVAGGSVQLWDVHNCRKVGEAPRAHRLAARCVDWAPNNEHRLVSCGDDGRLRFWDTRQLGRCEPLLELSGHSHWVWCARYNPHHDQLLASGSTDCSVALWYAPALAKLREAPAAAAAGGGGGGGGGAGGRPKAGRPAAGADGRVALFDEEHEDSVYGLAWSAADAWLLASMSYDGRVVVGAVPKGLKYKILI
ncbi:WD repeat-containing protein [Raphidocelis subcapitata]|uniref:WD repeat-containing protein n=1 Tax=Raphidocelis subcapitata TaxID=307507 RepID=A0A2V0NRN2_9CHLO|nr:WD repeat-containing protein [Raphidocelis subcapitata]|eukprot:GBF90294.1 WD repeat-containing protein [Raphidocelis subcapitata]